MTNASPSSHEASGTDPAVFAIWTRALDDQRMAGRLRIALSIREAINTAGGYRGVIMPSILSHKTWFKWLEALKVLVDGLLAGRPLPLQCVLFSAPRDIEVMCRQVPRESVVYVDGIRLFAVAERLRTDRPHQQIVIDLDDLHSRRMELLLNGRLPLSPGYLAEKIPPFLRVLISIFSRWILLYDRDALRRIERDVLHLANAVVLLSKEDCRALRELAGPELGARVHNIPPAVATPREAPPPFDRVGRFVFVGTDGLTQNRLTIDYLVELWRKRRPATPLVIFGKQWRKTPLPDGVTAAGYVESLSEIYDDRSVLLTPSFLRGGIKTKVLEAFAHRVPVIGNECTFESTDFHDYPFSLEGEEALLDLIENPDNSTPALRLAADQGYDRIRDRYSPELFARRWRTVLGLSPDGGERAQRATGGPKIAL